MAKDDIGAKVKTFIAGMKSLTKALAEGTASDKDKFPADVTFAIARNKASVVRRPEEQAAEVQRDGS
jgi:hypothetical protein